MSKVKRILPDGPISEEEYYTARGVIQVYEGQERRKETDRMYNDGTTTANSPSTHYNMETKEEFIRKRGLIY